MRKSIWLMSALAVVPLMASAQEVTKFDQTVSEYGVPLSVCFGKLPNHSELWTVGRRNGESAELNVMTADGVDRDAWISGDDSSTVSISTDDGLYVFDLESFKYLSYGGESDEGRCSEIYAGSRALNNLFNAHLETVDDFRETISTLEVALARALLELGETKARKQEAEAAMNDMRSQAEVLFEEVKVGLDGIELSGSVEKVLAAFEEILQTKDSLLVLQIAMEELEAENDRLLATSSADRVELGQKRIQLDDAKHDLEDAQNQLDIMNRLVEGQKRDLRLLTIEVAQLRELSGGLQMQIDDAEAKDIACQVQITNLGSRLNTALTRAASSERRLRQQNDELLSLEQCREAIQTLN